MVAVIETGISVQIDQELSSHVTLAPLEYCYSAILGEFKHEVRQFEKSYDNQQAEQISLMV